MSGHKFEKKSLFELLADSIEAQIRQEDWKGLLPSGRDLAEQHKVSLPTVQKAIALLIERKVLISRGGKRRLEIKGQGQLSRAEGQPYEVLVLSTAPLTSYDVTISLGVQQLGQELKAAGHGYRFVDLSGVEGVARRKAAQAEITVSRPTHCVLMRPDAHVYAAAARHPAKLATMFSDLRVRRPTALGVRYGYLVDIALRHLCPLGHRRFFMPFLGRKTALRTSMQGIARAARKHGVSVQVMRTAQELTAENMAAALDRGLAEGATASCSRSGSTSCRRLLISPVKAWSFRAISRWPLWSAVLFRSVTRRRSPVASVRMRASPSRPCSGSRRARSKTMSMPTSTRVHGSQEVRSARR